MPGRVDLVATPTSAGYWVLTETGTIFAFGDARFHGAPSPLGGGDRFVSLASTPGRRRLLGLLGPGPGRSRSGTPWPTAT